MNTARHSVNTSASYEEGARQTPPLDVRFESSIQSATIPVTAQVVVRNKRWSAQKKEALIAG